MPLPWKLMRSSDWTSLIVPFGHKPSDLATSNLDLQPELLGKMDERPGDSQCNRRVKKCGFEFVLRPQCVCGFIKPTRQ